jgi:hypothetical protein
MSTPARFVVYLPPAHETGAAPHVVLMAAPAAPVAAAAPTAAASTGSKAVNVAIWIAVAAALGVAAWYMWPVLGPAAAGLFAKLRHKSSGGSAPAGASYSSYGTEIGHGELRGFSFGDMSKEAPQIGGFDFADVAKDDVLGLIAQGGDRQSGGGDRQSGGG